MPERIPTMIREIRVITVALIATVVFALVAIGLGAYALTTAVGSNHDALAREQAARKDEVARVKAEVDGELRAAQQQGRATFCALLHTLPRSALTGAVQRAYCPGTTLQPPSTTGPVDFPDPTMIPQPQPQPQPQPVPTVVIIPSASPVPGPTVTVTRTVAAPTRGPSPSPTPAPCRVHAGHRCIIP